MVSFWANRRVMVTGGAGFLGRYVVGMPRERGADVHVADMDRYDWRNLEDIGRALGEGRPHMVIHHGMAKKMLLV